MSVNKPITLRLAHSPDPDDAFMWWPLMSIDDEPPRIDTGPWRFEPVLVDIESANERAEHGEYEITAISCAQYPRVKHRYAITACGASVGEGYGPKLIARERMTPDQLREREARVAVPGIRTTAFAATSLLLGPASFTFEAVPFEEILDRVADSSYGFDAGVVIHEGQLTYESQGLHLVADLGAWWQSTHNLPLPLGANAIRRDLEDTHGRGTLSDITRLLHESVEFAMNHRDEGLRHALVHARGLDGGLADEFVGMYVNQWTLNFGQVGRDALRTLLRESSAAGLSPSPDPIDFIEPA